jgi:hypothetical protein
VPIVPYAVDVPESTHDSAALDAISALLVVVASKPLSVRTIELVLPVPHTTAPAAVPYAAPTARVPRVWSAATVVGPVNLTTDDSPVGNV